MCGRYVTVARRAELRELYRAGGPGDGRELAPSYNVAPTNTVYAVVQRPAGDAARGDGTGGDGTGGDVREVRAVRWGLVPAWWRPGTDPKTGKPRRMPALHNARADRLATAPSWRGPFARRRAVIPAAGYYEWLTEDDGAGGTLKQPYYVHPDDGVLSFAGLYETWADPGKADDDPGRWRWSAAIVTHHATWLAGQLNERTPVILPADRVDAWLDPHLTDKARVQRLISGIEYPLLRVRKVSTTVNRTGRSAGRGPELIEPVDARGDSPLQLAAT